jgi:hypothetical protein
VKENRDGEKRARRSEGTKATPTKQNKNDERSLCKFFANSRFPPPPRPNLPVPFCRGNLPALDENGIVKQHLQMDEIYIYLEETVDI